jgi:hypothetical protein
MNGREIEVHIEELVLHGIDPRLRWRIADALESRLSAILAQDGLPNRWLSNQERLDTGLLRERATSDAPRFGAAIADALCRGAQE